MRQRFTPNALRTLCLAALCAAVGCASSAQRQEAPGNGISPPGKTQTAVSGRGHVAAGRDLLKRGLLDEAEREFRLAIEADANDLEAVAGLGQVEVARGQYSEGMAHLERATRVPSQMVSALRSLGDAYTATGDLTRAASAYRQAVALSPTDVDMRLALVRSLTEIGEYGEAKTVCADAIRLAKGNPATLAQAYRQMGEVYSREGNTPEGFAALYKSAELDPRNTQTAKALATCAVRAGLYAEAAAAYNRVLKLAPLDVEAKKQLAWVNFKMERFPVAIKHYEAVGDSLGTVDRYYLAQAYAKSNRRPGGGAVPGRRANRSGQLQGRLLQHGVRVLRGQPLSACDRGGARGPRQGLEQRMPSLLLGTGAGQAGPPRRGDPGFRDRSQRPGLRRIGETRAGAPAADRPAPQIEGEGRGLTWVEHTRIKEDQCFMHLFAP